jgi:hypothetical protein
VNWEAIGAIGEIVAAAAVIVTLAYLARQIRENTNAVQAATELDVAQQHAAWYGRRTAEERLVHARAVRREALSKADAQTYVWMQAEYLHLCEGWYRQFARGLMHAEVWEPLADGAIAILATPYMERWWEGSTNLSPLSPGFRRYLDERRAKHPERWTTEPVPDATDGERHATEP